jgi:hypothetical protein
MPAMERMPTRTPEMQYQFAKADLAATQTATVVPILGGVVNTYAMRRAGYIVGYAVNKSAATSAGTTAIDITVNGTSVKTISIDTASTTVFRGSMPRPALRFAAGDTLGVTYTTDGSHAPTTQDIVVEVDVLFEEEDV